LAKVFGRLWGRHFLHVQHADHLLGRFNAHLRDTIVLFADECFWAGDKKHEGQLKALVTEETLAIEDKGVRVVVAPNYTHLIVASNENWVVPIGAGDRRFCVLDVSNDHMQDLPYFQAMDRSLEADDGLGYSNLVHHLLQVDLTGFQVRNIPDTEARREQKMLSLTVEQDWWLRKLEEGMILRGVEDWQKPVITRAVYDDYIEYGKMVGQNRRSFEMALTAFLQKSCPGDYPHKTRQMFTSLEPGPGGAPCKTQVREYVFHFPPLAECRAMWDSLHGKRDWPDPDQNMPPF